MEKTPAAVHDTVDARLTAAGASGDAHVFAVPSVGLPVPETPHAAPGVEHTVSDTTPAPAPAPSARDAATADNKGPVFSQSCWLIALPVAVFCTVHFGCMN